MNATTTAAIDIGNALLMAGSSIPLILRKVPMNPVYGIKFPQSYKSEKAWYEINEYGGKVLLFWSIPVFLVGVFGLLKPELPRYYPIIALGALVFSLLIACFQCYLKARQIDKDES